MRILLTVSICFVALPLTPICRSQENKPEYRGVSQAELQDGTGQIKNGQNARIIEMSDRLIVEVSNLDGWLYDSVRAGNFPKQEWFDPAVIKLIADTDLKTLYTKTTLTTADAQHDLFEQARESADKMLSDVKQRLYLQLGPARLRHLHAEDPLIRQSDAGVFRFVFPIHDTPEDRPEWNKLRSTRGQLRPVSISVAFDLEGLTHTLRTKLGSSLDSVVSGMPEQQFKFRVYSGYRAAAFAVIYVMFVILFFWFTKVPNLVRDPDGPIRAGKHVFSLARCQLAWWFFVILGAWLFLWVTTSSRDTLNQTALIVSGIGSAAALSGTLAGKVRDSVTSSTLANVDVQMEQRPPGFKAGPGAVLYDLLSDRDTVGFHRFQLLVWNVILGGVFLWQTWNDLSMPEFNATLLGLLGLSAATFVGMKMTPASDTQKAAAAPPVPPA
jgi:hypothetical protein